MALSKTVLGALIKTKMLAADSTNTNPVMVENFANAIADAIVTHITGAGVVTIPTSAIATPSGGSGPPAPVALSIT